ncbi:nuclear transport factor 2 family protein [bacterium]|nr:nuclear transport factor 2 family protein [bacterium]
MRTILAALAVIFIAGCSQQAADQSADHAAIDPAAHQAHENYVAAINSNDLDSLLEMFTDDVVFMAPNSPVMEGKQALMPWLEGYLAAYQTHWVKTVDEFVVAGEWAFERYSYKSTDTSLEDGSVYEDTGWGLVIYHRDADGKWRVARDAWGQDHPLTE